MKNNVFVFDKPYSASKIAEGRAVQWAIISGACNSCKCFKECESNSNFLFPQDAPCMKKKAEFLKESVSDAK